MSNSFTKKAEEALSNCQKIAEEMYHSYIGTEHLLLALASIPDCTACYIMKRCDVTKEKINSVIGESKKARRQAPLTSRDTTPRLRRIIEQSYVVAGSFYSDKIGTEHLLISLLEEKESIAFKIMQKLAVEPEIIKNDCIDYVKGTEISIRGRHGVLDESKIPNLLKYGKNMTAYAKEVGYEPIVERERESARLIRILTRKNKNNPCLIGEAGVGKTAIVEGLAMKIASGDVPEMLRDKTIISVDLTSMVAGAKYRGDFEERIKSIVKEARKFQSIILFIDEIHTIVGAGAAEGAIDAANILKPELARGDIKLIGATTISEYRRYIEKDAALERRFQAVLVEEPSREQTVRILKSIRQRYEEYHRTIIDDEAIESAVSLSSRYITDRYLPDKAIDLIDEACALVKSERRDKNADFVKNCYDFSRNQADLNKYFNFEVSTEIAPQMQPRVTGEVIRELVSEITGIDIGKKNSLNIRDIGERLKRRVIGQDEAIDALSHVLIRCSVGLSNPSRPRGVFLFLGESGVGKTELARALSDELFEGENTLIRYDMTEFSEKGAVSKIIGAAPGYVGYDETNSLLERIRLHPHSVVLLDEIEKAHPDVLSLFLTIFDEGILTDSSGRKINFKNTYIILTSNVGNDAHRLKSKTGFLKDNNDSALQSSLKDYFSEEFINRIDRIIVFNRLTLEDLTKISINKLREISEKFLEIGIKCNISDEVAPYFAAECKKINMGARVLLRKITDEVEGGVATMIANGSIADDNAVDVLIENKKIAFNIKCKEQLLK